MKHGVVAAIGSVSLIAVLSLAGCASSDSPDTAPAPNQSSVASTPESKAPESAPASEIEGDVQDFMDALDGLGIEHTEPVRAAVGLSGAKARFDLTVNGFDAGINIFPDAETLVTWGEASDAFGGIYVAHGNAVLSLNSSEGIADSAEIAPKIAAAIGGEAHGV